MRVLRTFYGISRCFLIDSCQRLNILPTVLSEVIIPSRRIIARIFFFDQAGYCFRNYITQIVTSQGVTGWRLCLGRVDSSFNPVIP